MSIRNFIGEAKNKKGEVFILALLMLNILSQQMNFLNHIFRCHTFISGGPIEYL